MRRRLTLWLLIVNLALLVALGGLFALNHYQLSRAKRDAWQTMNGRTAEQRANLNAIPVRLNVPEVAQETTMLQHVTIGSYRVRVLKAQAQKPEKASLILTYPTFLVRIMEPKSKSECDDLARKAGFSDAFEFKSLLYRARLDDIDLQKDIPSLNGQLFLLKGKATLLSRGPEEYAFAAYLAEFERRDLRGFVFAANGQKTQLIADLRGPAGFCGLAFTDAGGMTTTDVEQFLAVFQFENSK